MSHQEQLLDVEGPPASGTGYVARAGVPRRKRSPVTSLTLHAEERELLERLAVHNGVSLAEVWRRGLRAYARESGVDAAVAPRTFQHGGRRTKNATGTTISPTATTGDTANPDA